MHKTQGQNVAKRLLTLEKFITEEFLKQNILVKTEQITNINRAGPNSFEVYLVCLGLE